LFALGDLAWILAPTASPLIQYLTPLVVALVGSNALAMVVIGGIVALMIGGRSQSRIEPNRDRIIEEGVVLPRFAENPNERSKWEADISLSDAARYLTSKAVWRRTKQSMGTRDVAREIQNSLINGKLTAWAKEHPTDDDRHQIRSDAWPHAEMTLENNCAFFPIVECTGYEIRMSHGELETAYPAG
jgi:hypothetical protein